MKTNQFRGKWAVPVYVQAIKRADRVDLAELREAYWQEVKRLRPRERLVKALMTKIGELEGLLS